LYDRDKVQPLIQPSRSPWRILHWCSFYCPQSPFNFCLLSWWTCERLQFFSNRLFLLVVKRHLTTDKWVKGARLMQLSRTSSPSWSSSKSSPTFSPTWTLLNQTQGFDGNSINNDNLNRTWAMPISLTLIAFSNSTSDGDEQRRIIGNKH